jgi:hypothetical protein
MPDVDPTDLPLPARSTVPRKRAAVGNYLGRGLGSGAAPWPAPEVYCTPSRQFRWLAQPRAHGLFVGEVLVFLLLRESKAVDHANQKA